MTANAGARFAYVKRGDVTDELRRLGPSRPPVDGGPDHYIASFLRWIGSAPALILAYGDRNDFAQSGTVAARLFGPAFRSALLRPLTETIRLARLTTALVRFRPNFILCAASDSALIASFMASRILRARFVHTRHDRVKHGSRDPFRWLMRRVNLRILRSADMIMCHGPFLEQQLLDAGVDEEKLVQFNLSYDYLLRDIEHEDTAPIRVLGEQNLLYTGRVSTNKGVFDLLEAAVPLLKANRSLHLIYAGDGPQSSELRQAIASNGLETQVTMLGFVPHDRLAALIRQCDAVVSPTRRELPESRCKSAIEALILSIPVIAPNYGPFPYIVKDEWNGLLYEPDSIVDLRRKLDRIVTDSGTGNWSRIKEGAHESGRELIKSKRDFVQALDCALNNPALGVAE